MSGRIDLAERGGSVSDLGPDDAALEGLTGDEQIIAEAKARFRRAREWESTTRERALTDLKFACGDPDNGWQWDGDALDDRDLDDSPSLTLNKVRVHCLQIENEARKNKPAISIRPTGAGASYEASQVYEGMCRAIERRSRAPSAYMTASKFQVRTGIGYTRLVTDYVGPDTFDQDLFIRRVKDPTTITLDPDINEEDGSDARFGFVHDDMPRDEFRQKYPKFKDVSATMGLGDDNDIGMTTEHHVRVCEYFRKSEVKDKLIQASDPTSGDPNDPTSWKQVVIRASKYPKEYVKVLTQSLDAKTRDILDAKVDWYVIAGGEIVDRREWLGSYIPIARCVGEETIVDKKLDRKGHVRPMKDAQRQYNYWSSATTASIALQPQQPWLLDPTSIEENESVWESANTKKHAFLPYKKFDDEGRENAKPERVAPPMLPEALIKGLELAQQDMMMVTGQYQAQLGENENAKSGKAISERQAQGDNATYHFNDGLASMIRHLGTMIVELIPLVYDTPRIIKILAEDDTEQEIQVDPSAKQAYQVKQMAEGQAVQAIFNPTVGTYEVEADVGPDYATKRQEAYNALTQLMSANKDLMLWAGDLLMKVCDFPMADELAQRLKRMVPPQALGEAPPPQIQQQIAQLTEQNHSLQNLVNELLKKAAEDAIKIKNHDSQKDIDVYDAQTRRITATSNAVPELGDKGGLHAVIQQTMHDAVTGTDLAPVVAAGAPGLDMAADKANAPAGETASG